MAYTRQHQHILYKKKPASLKYDEVTKTAGDHYSKRKINTYRNAFDMKITAYDYSHQPAVRHDREDHRLTISYAAITIIYI
jgi:hypothetical protein